MGSVITAVVIVIGIVTLVVLSLWSKIDPERLLFGIAASGGLVMAASIGGLPSATCAALAETYARAINGFGGLAVLSLLAVAAIKASFSSSVLVGFIIVLALLTIASSNQNLHASILHCYIGSDAEIAARLHQRIELAGPFSFERLLAAFPGWED